jgi:hypothetical protein
MAKSMATNVKMGFFMARIIVAPVKPQQMIENIGKKLAPSRLQKE